MRKLFLAALLTILLPTAAKASEKIVLNSANTVVFRGVVDGTSTTLAQLQLVKQVVKRGFKNYPIYLVLDSPGGSIDAGYMFVQFAKHIPNLHTISIFAASMASAIAEELPGKRYVTENGTMMFHKAYAGLEGTVETGNLETRLYYVKKQVLTLENANASRMRMTLSDYKSLIANELWLDGPDSVTYRAADQMVDIVCTVELIAQTRQVNIMSLFGAASFQFSACPLFRVPLSGSDARVKYSFGPSSVRTK